MTTQVANPYRVLFILHRALVEIRLLAQGGQTTQAYDLADAVEPFPGLLAAWNDEHLAVVRDNLEGYASKYPTAFQYLDFLDKYPPPAF